MRLHIRSSPVNNVKITLVLILIVLAVTQCTAWSGEVAAEESRIRLSFDGKEAIVRLSDNQTTRDLLSRLPLTLDFRDYVGKEKIAYLSNKLSSDGSSAQSSGDFAYYAPWGNLAIFYRGNGNAGGGLIVLGVLESGKADLASMSADFTMTLECVD